jgi:hypothetical protein
MNRTRHLALVFVAALGLAGAAQHTTPSKPDFSGVWNGIPDPAPLPPRKADELIASPDWSSPLTLTQTATTLTAEYRTNARSHAQRRFVYSLDGTETANQLTGAIDPVGRRSTATWNGDTLLLTDAVDWPDRAAGTTTKRLDRKALTLESPDVLRVEATLVLGDGTSAPRVLRFKRAAGR